MTLNKLFIRYFILSLGLFVFPFQANAQLYKELSSPKTEYWVDSVYNSLTLEEKIGQLIFVRANQSGSGYISEVDNYIKDYNVGGIVFFRSTPMKQAIQTNKWKKMSKTPIMIAIDAEWGLGMRLSNTIKYPLQMPLGAVQDENLIYEMGSQIAFQCKRMGIHINFAPVVDVNSNPVNPVIGMRSFGSNPQDVSRKATLYMKGMQDNGIIACAKHFPGHGDTKSDSHLTLPVVLAKKKELRKNELFPFGYLSEEGVAAMMTAHLSVPALDKRKNRPTSLSYKVVTKLLKKKMGFDGLIITDGLDMKGVTKYYNKGEVAREAFMAGNDILLIPDDVKASVESIKQLIIDKKDYSRRLEESCKKILTYKYLSGAWKNELVDTANLINDLNLKEYHDLQETLVNKSITLVKNKDKIIPISRPDTLKTAVVVMGYDDTPFEKVINNLLNAEVYHLKHNAKSTEYQKVIDEITDDNLVIIALTNTNINAHRKFGITNSDLQFINTIARKKRVVLDVFASPYALNFFTNLSIFDAVLISYQDKNMIMKRSAEVITGMAECSGKLPVGLNAYDRGHGLFSPKTRISFVSPEDVGANPIYLAKIDSIVENSIEIQATPGCQIVALKDGDVFFSKSYGFHTYDKKNKVKDDDLYDVASLTKIMATTPSLMQIYQQGIIDIDKPISDYLLYLKKSNKKDIIIKEILSHQAGLFPWIPYYQNTLSLNSWDTSVYHSMISEEFPIRVAKDMYINKYYKYDIYKQIAESPLGEKKYKYSDLGFYLFRQLIELAVNNTLENYTQTEFYKPLGLKTMTFLPLEKFSANKICPTENDREFRFQTLDGDVHDQGAAMLGGVSGHAGLFSNAMDVAVMMQMYLNNGNYGGRQYVDSTVVKEFTSRHFEENENRRGLGFDKPLLEYEDHGPNCKSASEASFGHSGFTGCYAWADPENNLVYVFLSNRVYPDMYNNKLGELDVRTNIHELFYKAFAHKQK